MVGVVAEGYVSMRACALLHKALGQAARDGLIPRNVTEAVKVPQIKREEIQALCAGETKRLLEAARGDRLEALYVLAVTTGLRQGELLALKWDDMDLERRVLRVRRTLTRVKGKVFLGEPKTAKSHRASNSPPSPQPRCKSINPASWRR